MTIAKLRHEIAVLRRFQFGKKREQDSNAQGTMLQQAAAADIAAIEEEHQQLIESTQGKTAPTTQAQNLTAWIAAYRNLPQSAEHQPLYR